jgi:thiamine phosphate synthase YjbQ (UPF0047 family)
MATRPLELELELSPRTRYDAMDVADTIRREFGDILHDYRRVLYTSHHTTAGYLDQRLAARLHDSRDLVDPFIRRFQRLFPRGAGYRHDEMHLRSELSEEERRVEPPNGDAHLTFIGSGLQNCVTYLHQPGAPVFLMDLDGMYRGHPRRRTTSVVGYSLERAVERIRCDIPVSGHTIDSIDLYGAHSELRLRIEELLRSHSIEAGRIDIRLDDDERGVALTVNEFETLLMRHDLAEVLDDPLRFVARQGRRILNDPRAVPAKSLGYARYDVVQVMNRMIDVLGLGGSFVERLLSRIMALPAARRLHLKRSVSLAVTTANGGRAPHVVRGRYQSPILIQWQATPRRSRALELTLNSFD